MPSTALSRLLFFFVLAVWRCLLRRCRRHLSLPLASTKPKRLPPGVEAQKRGRRAPPPSGDPPPNRCSGPPAGASEAGFGTAIPRVAETAFINCLSGPERR